MGSKSKAGRREHGGEWQSSQCLVYKDQTGRTRKLDPRSRGRDLRWTRAGLQAMSTESRELLPALAQLDSNALRIPWAQLCLSHFGFCKANKIEELSVQGCTLLAKSPCLPLHFASRIWTQAPGWWQLGSCRLGARQNQVGFQLCGLPQALWP